MNPVFFKAIISALTFLTLLFCLGFAVIGFVKGSVILAVTCLMLTAGFGMFSFRDFKFWVAFFKKSAPPKV
jgi:hypothetical protein